MMTARDEDDFTLAVMLRFLISVREANGLSRAAVAAAIGVDERWVSELESDPQGVRASSLQRYVRALGGRVTFALEPLDSGRGDISTTDRVAETLPR